MLRATMVTLAPLEARSRATLRPMPCDPPVMRTVYSFQWFIYLGKRGLELTRSSTGNWLVLSKKPILSAIKMETKIQKSTEVQRNPNTIAYTPYMR